MCISSEAVFVHVDYNKGQRGWKLRTGKELTFVLSAWGNLITEFCWQADAHQEVCWDGVDLEQSLLQTGGQLCDTSAGGAPPSLPQQQQSDRRPQLPREAAGASSCGSIACFDTFLTLAGAAVGGKGCSCNVVQQLMMLTSHSKMDAFKSFRILCIRAWHALE